jgi:AAA15 family ATPase/GTPase
MAMIEGFRIQSYRALHDIAMGRTGTDQQLRYAKSLTPLTALIGENGVEKSSIFDAFGIPFPGILLPLNIFCNRTRK